MALKKLSPSTTASLPRDGKAMLSIGFGPGVFSFNKQACEQLGITAGCACQLHQDEDEPMNWYVSFVEEDGFILRDNNKVSQLVFNSASIAHQIQKLFPEADTIQSLRCMISTEPEDIDGVEYYGVILSSANLKIKK